MGSGFRRSCEEARIRERKEAAEAEAAMNGATSRVSPRSSSRSECTPPAFSFSSEEKLASEEDAKVFHLENSEASEEIIHSGAEKVVQSQRLSLSTWWQRRDNALELVP